MSTPINEVPWMVQGGAKHTVEVTRNLAYMAAGGVEGIVRGADLEVRELAVPDGFVRVFPGTGAVLNRAPGHKDEMYVARVATQQQVAVPASGASAQHYMVVLRIENPYEDNYQLPADPAVGPYASLAVIECGPNANGTDDLGLSERNTMIPLPRIDVPASTGTITQGMITDLRTMANSVSKTESTIIAPSTEDPLTHSEFRNWPAEAVFFVDIPEWATHARTKVILGGIRKDAGNCVGDLRVQVDGPSGTPFYTQTTRLNVDSDNPDRATIMCGSPNTPLPRNDRGHKGVPFRLEARKTGGASTLYSDNRSMVSIEIEFKNEPDTNV